MRELIEKDFGKGGGGVGSPESQCAGGVANSNGRIAIPRARTNSLCGHGGCRYIKLGTAHSARSPEQPVTKRWRTALVGNKEPAAVFRISA